MRMRMDGVIVWNILRNRHEIIGKGTEYSVRYTPYSQREKVRKTMTNGIDWWQWVLWYISELRHVAEASLQVWRGRAVRHPPGQVAASSHWAVQRQFILPILVTP
jgi:hypothetical protein